ncbi:MAG: type I pullulanase [Bacteroidales bacterium]|nr:type I pullulanase [Bacteroidales bacterium]
MTQIRLTVLLALFLTACMPIEKVFNSLDEYPAPVHENLWPSFSSKASELKIWSPAALEVKLIIYPSGNNSEPEDSLNFHEAHHGIWMLSLAKDLSGKYYTFKVKTRDGWLDETPGIYAQAVGVNGQRAMAIQLDSCNPPHWNQDRFVNLLYPNQAVIYEMHVRDFTIHQASGSSFPGKYAGIGEIGTVSPINKIPTGIDHLKALGITHVHLLPVFDHQSIDESKLEEPQFNWGYDPQNYNVPEGSFSSNPFRAEVRIQEFKAMVQALHKAGIGVIMDVVYNHTGKTVGSNFNLECPNYYYRQDTTGKFSNASGCGNETASERPMMQKFMLESLLFWQGEYHIDGFRFDLMGIHDIETMNKIADTLKEINPSAIIYGEGWTAGATPLPVEKQALKRHAPFMRNVSVFNDDLRDGIKGSVFEDKSTGFVTGAAGLEESIKFGVVGAVLHDDLKYKQVNYSDTTWAIEPWQSVNYVSCHDNHTLYDKLMISRPNASEEDRIKMHLLALGIVLTSQGIPFLHAGTELLRTKQGEHNSYNLGDEINAIDWTRKAMYPQVFDYLSQLIQLRRNHPAFRLPSAGFIRKHLNFLDTQPGSVVFTLTNVDNESWKDIVVVYNAKTETLAYPMPGIWTIVALEDEVNEQGILWMKDALNVPPLSLLIAIKK